jgi:hypothetical protein
LKDTDPRTVAAGIDGGASSIDELERQAADLEKQAKYLREKVEALKVKPKNDHAAKASATDASN